MYYENINYVFVTFDDRDQIKNILEYITNAFLTKHYLRTWSKSTLVYPAKWNLMQKII